MRGCAHGTDGEAIAAGGEPPAKGFPLLAAAAGAPASVASATSAASVGCTTFPCLPPKGSSGEDSLRERRHLASDFPPVQAVESTLLTELGVGSKHVLASDFVHSTLSFWLAGVAEGLQLRLLLLHGLGSSGKRCRLLRPLSAGVFDIFLSPKDRTLISGGFRPTTSGDAMCFGIAAMWASMLLARVAGSCLDKLLHIRRGFSIYAAPRYMRLTWN